MSNYPDGMTGAHWAYLDGDECEECEDDCTCEELTAGDIALENARL